MTAKLFNLPLKIKTKKIKIRRKNEPEYIILDFSKNQNMIKLPNGDIITTNDIISFNQQTGELIYRDPSTLDLKTVKINIDNEDKLDKTYAGLLESIVTRMEDKKTKEEKQETSEKQIIFI